MHSYNYIFCLFVCLFVCCIQPIAEKNKNDADFNRFNLTVKTLDLDEAKLNQIDEVVALYKIS